MEAAGCDEPCSPLSQKGGSKQKSRCPSHLMSCFDSAGTNRKAPACVFISHEVLPAILPLTSGNVRAAGNPPLCWLCCFNNYGSQSPCPFCPAAPAEEHGAGDTPRVPGRRRTPAPRPPGPRAWPAWRFLPPEQQSPACFHPEAQ